MPQANLVILYVDSPPASAEFYADLLGERPIESSPTFAMLALGKHMRLGLWSRHTVEPRAIATAGGGEICFHADSAEALNETYLQWRAKGLTMAQAPCDMDFGRTFVALDPDGHRLRVFFPSEESRP